MFIILVMPSTSGGAVSLFYKTKEAAEIAQKNIYDFQKGDILSVLVAKDDFGHVLTIGKHNLGYAILIDHEKTAQLGPPPGTQSSGISRQPGGVV